MRPELRAILFDLDGTLVDSAPDLGAAVDKMRVDRGLASRPLEDYRSMAGAGARGMLGVAFGMSPDDPDYAAMREEFFANYEACLTERTRVFDGIERVIANLADRGLAWGVVTNKAERFSLPLTRGIALFSTAATVVSGDTTPYSKPHPEPLLEAARRLELPPQACAYVGDDERDIVAGKAAGMFTVAATYGYLGAGNDVAAWAADAIADSPHALLKVIEHLHSRQSA